MTPTNSLVTLRRLQLIVAQLLHVVASLAVRRSDSK